METRLIIILIKVGVVLMITGGLMRATYHYARAVAYQEQFGLIKLGKFSRSLEAGH